MRSHAAHALVRALATRPLTTPARTVDGKSELTQYVANLALEAGFSAEHVEIFEDDLGALLSGGGGFVFSPFSGDDVFVVVEGGRRVVVFLDAAGQRVEVPRAEAERTLASAGVERIRRTAARLGNSGIGGDERLVRALRRELSKSSPVGWGYVLRPNVAETIPRLMKSLRFGSYAAKLLALSGAQSVLTTLAWAIIGSLAIAGRAETGSLLGWALLSVTATMIQVVATRFVGRFTIRAATALRERLLEGALNLDPEGLGSFGLGGLMVIATQADAFLNSVVVLFLALLGVLTNLVAAAVVLSMAPMPLLTISLLMGFVLGVVATAWRVAKLARNQQQQRMDLTTDMVERMLGHRTRLVQQTPNSWHAGEDEAVHAYALDSRRFDRLTVALRAAPRAYYLLATGAAFLVLVAGPNQVTLALSIGGMTLGMGALAALVELVLSAGSLHALWRAIQPVVADSKLPEVGAAVSIPDDVTSGAEGSTLVELRGVHFGYPSRARPVLHDASLVIAPRDRVLVEGPSGGGKTTLAALLTGMRKPDAGLVLVGGMDQHTIREPELRRLIASAPQFYKNHIFAESLAFNLLLARAWPPEDEDVREATQVAEELGLGPLLERMPAGIHQNVGDTGWQLSHGEKSRVYLARALLQRAPLLVLDETFGALDPDNLRQCMQVVLERAQTLVVVTHR
jgi:ATP-binding cassette, subfamily B, bacterial